jgi:hypothetical protein
MLLYSILQNRLPHNCTTLFSAQPRQERAEHALTLYSLAPDHDFRYLSEGYFEVNLYIRNKSRVVSEFAGLAADIVL